MDKTRSTPRADQAPRPKPDRRRPYRAPVLTEYGPVAKLTQMNFNGSLGDGGGGFFRRMTCL
jgi:hypothetical protein